MSAPFCAVGLAGEAGFDVARPNTIGQRAYLRPMRQIAFQRCLPSRILRQFHSAWGRHGGASIAAGQMCRPRRDPAQARAPRSGIGECRGLLHKPIKEGEPDQRHHEGPKGAPIGFPKLKVNISHDRFLGFRHGLSLRLEESSNLGSGGIWVIVAAGRSEFSTFSLLLVEAMPKKPIAIRPAPAIISQ